MAYLINENFQYESNGDAISKISLYVAKIRKRKEKKEKKGMKKDCTETHRAAMNGKLLKQPEGQRHAFSHESAIYLPKII